MNKNNIITEININNDTKIDTKQNLSITNFILELLNKILNRNNSVISQIQNKSFNGPYKLNKLFVSISKEKNIIIYACKRVKKIDINKKM